MSISECGCVFYKIFNSVRLSEWVFCLSETVLRREKEGPRASVHKGVAICKPERLHKLTVLWWFSCLSPTTARKPRGKI